MRPSSATSGWLSGREFGGQIMRLDPGRIFEVARDGGIQLPEVCRDKQSLRCPFHTDRHASAFLSVNNVFYCSVCTPEGGWTAKKFARELRVPWNGRRLHPPEFRPRPTRSAAPAPTLSPEEAQGLWFRARASALSGPGQHAEHPVRQYLAKRGLSKALDAGLAGVLDDDAVLPSSISWWPSQSYRLVAPLFDAGGRLVNVQARAILRAERKVLFPPGSRAKGALFANGSGREVLSGDWGGAKVVVVGEGLTDSLALSICSSQPVLGIPGTGAAGSSFGPWVRGMTVCLALDMDSAGEAACEVAARTAREGGAKRVRQISWPRGCKDACDALQVLGPAGLGHLLGRCYADG